MKETMEMPIAPSSEIKDETSKETNPNKLAGLLDRAIQHGDLKELEDLFENGMDINQTDYEGRTALQMMSFTGKIDAIEMLLSKGADINRVFLYQGRVPMTALDAAKEGRKQNVVDLLLSNGARTGRDIESTDETAK